MKKLTVLFLAFVCFIWSHAHVGSPGVTLEGDAGPYRLMVLINPPEVIPGVAFVDIYIESGTPEQVMVQPVYWWAGGKGTPKADQALPVEGEPGHYQGQLWLMSSGTSSVKIEVDGAEGTGEILVPVMAVSTAQKEMDSSLGVTLGILAVFLVILIVTILSLSISDSRVRENSELNKSSGRKRWRGAIVATVIMLIVLYGGKTWWDGWAEGYNRFLYRPWEATSTVSNQQDSTQLLNFRLDDMDLPTLYITRKISYIVPDHGKLMHMFLVKEGGLDAFAHIHPMRKDTVNFDAVLPPLPAGRYIAYADITRLSGFSETIVDTVDIPDTPVSIQNVVNALDEDDTFFITDPIQATNENLPSVELGDIVVCGVPGQKTTLPDGTQAVFELPNDERFVANRLYPLTFAMFDEEGEPAALEPYLGMAGHAVVLKEDGSTYIHLHPVGNYSTASQQTLESRMGDVDPVSVSDLPPARVFVDSIDQYVQKLAELPPLTRDSILMLGMDHDWEDPDHPDHSVVKFPYSFPSPGKYRIFIQMKRNGKILNSAFDVEVEES